LSFSSSSSSSSKVLEASAAELRGNDRISFARVLGKKRLQS
jgi:hypothetical protein